MPSDERSLRNLSERYEHMTSTESEPIGFRSKYKQWIILVSVINELVDPSDKTLKLLPSLSSVDLLSLNQQNLLKLAQAVSLI